MAGGKRKPIILMMYKMLFVAAFVAWVVFAFKRCFPYPLFYDFSSPAPVSFQSHDGYIDALKKYREQRVKQKQKEQFWQDVKGFFFNTGELWYDTGTPAVLVSDTGYGNYTNIQLDKANECAAIKNDGKYLYILSDHPSIKLDVYPHILLDGAVVVVDAYPPGEMEVVSKIWLTAGKSGETYKKYVGLYISGQNLVVLSEEYDYHNYYSRVTRADIYDMTDKNKPVHKRTLELDGMLVNSCEKDGILYLFTSKNIWLRYYGFYHRDTFQPPEITDPDRYIPYCSDTGHGGKQYVSADHIYTSLPKVTKNNYFMEVSAINMAAIDLGGNMPAEVSAYVYFGSDLQLYMKAESIYFMQEKRENEIYYTGIVRFGIDKAGIQYAASIKVPGQMHDRFWADEYNGNLRIATILYDKVNHLFVLDENLNFMSHIRYTTAGERNVSVCFDGEMVYAAPLFVFDLSDPRSPEIKADSLAAYNREINKRALIMSYDDNGNLKMVQAFADGVDRYNNIFAMDRVTCIENILYRFDDETLTAYDMNVKDGYDFKKICSVDYN